ncbi:MAG: right-handed parallel beta-helix repeat-containing protein [Nitrospira sp.]|nr:right-handed parallel beta-helix repeat-containing protein [Nitrospira sp.]
MVKMLGKARVNYYFSNFFLTLFYLGLLFACKVGASEKVAQPKSAVTESIQVFHKLTERELVTPEQFFAVGDGDHDDSDSFQKFLSFCSINNGICHIPSGKSYRISEPLYIWGSSELIGDGDDSKIIFSSTKHPFLINVGISGKNKLEMPFKGVISGIHFVAEGGRGRMIYFWRTLSAIIEENYFDLGDSEYSATSSGNNHEWVSSRENTIRKNITIRNNRINAASNEFGSEGIGVDSFVGVIIENNIVTGVGDDPIGVHVCSEVIIRNNVLESVDGRIYVSNSSSVEIYKNRHTRSRSARTGKFHQGIALIYIGFEVSGENGLPAPTNTDIHNNKLFYPKGAIDAGAAIYVNGARNTKLSDNLIVNDSEKVIASAIHVLPQRFSGFWQDPSDLDFDDVARVGDTFIENNISAGKVPLRIIMTGNCAEYSGIMKVKNNVASSYQLYCDNVDVENNK